LEGEHQAEDPEVAAVLLLVGVERLEEEAVFLLAEVEHLEVAEELMDLRTELHPRAGEEDPVEDPEAGAEEAPWQLVGWSPQLANCRSRGVGSRGWGRSARLAAIFFHHRLAFAPIHLVALKQRSGSTAAL